MDYFSIDILTPTRVLVKDAKADSLLVPTINGQINILMGHTHMITRLDTGILTIFGAEDYPDRNFSITTGVCKIQDKKILILSNVSEEYCEIDVERAQKALDFAKNKINSEALTDEKLAKYERKVERAQLRLQMAKEAAKNN